MYEQLELIRDGDVWQYSNLTIPFDIKYNDFDPNLQIVDPLLLNEAKLTWKCEGIACNENDVLAKEEIHFPGINFASGRPHFKFCLHGSRMIINQNILIL